MVLVILKDRASFEDGVATDEAFCTMEESSEEVEVSTLFDNMTPKLSTAGGRPVPAVVGRVFVAGTGVPVPGASFFAVP